MTRLLAALYLACCFLTAQDTPHALIFAATGWAVGLLACASLLSHFTKDGPA